MKFTTPVKLAAAVAIAGVLYLLGSHFNLLPGAKVQEAAVPKAFDMATGDGAEANNAAVEAIALPSSKPSTVRKPPIRVNIPAWNATMGLHFANGGPTTTANSLMEKHGLTVRVTRQNDFSVSQGEQVKFAQALHDGAANPAEGIHFSIIMGDGAAAYLAAANKLLEKLGPEYRAEIVGALGYSRGEDSFWGPAEWRDDPSSMRGKGVSGVLRDGDWNIVLFKAANDGVKNNPDETTYDPEAINWFATPDHLKAVDLYLQGYCETRPVVKAGKKTKETHKLCVDGVTTWTPGDVNLAKKKGGLVRLLSTQENAYQMPAVVIGIHKWNVDNAKKVEEFLAAAFEGADQVRAHPQALSRAAQAAFAVYAEESPAYWAKYYKGTLERDKTGIPVPLGGSTVANLGDNLLLFGLAEGSGGATSIFRATYEGFGNMAKQQYPGLVPDFPPIDQAVNTAILVSLAQRSPASQAATETFEDAGPIGAENVVAKRDWDIQFETGQATFTPAAQRTLDQLYNNLAVGNLVVDIAGHTDNVGSPEANQALSERRAAAVKGWLQRRAPTVFSEGRVTSQGFGADQPKGSNATAEGRAVNRRVTITLGTKG